MADLSDINAAQSVKLIGAASTGSEQAPVNATNGELRVVDSLNNGGINTTLALTTSPSEVRVGATRKANRKYIVMEALDNGVKWGFTSASQPFDLFKNQIIFIPIGENTEVWMRMTSGVGSAVIGEVS